MVAGSLGTLIAVLISKRLPEMDMYGIEFKNYDLDVYKGI